MITQTKETQSKLTSQDVLTQLKDGNARFLAGNNTDRNYKEQVNITSGGQAPMAVVLSCIDSRVPVETVFDLGIGDIFSARVAGNIVNEDMLGSMEYACKVAGSKLILVLGHSKCGAVTSACQGVELGNITPLLAKVKPAIEKSNYASHQDVEKVSKQNVLESIEQIKAKSEILADMDKNGEIEIVGGMYDVATGKVEFYS